jgi:hypothetical protein
MRLLSTSAQPKKAKNDAQAKKFYPGQDVFL